MAFGPHQNALNVDRLLHALEVCAGKCGYGASQTKKASNAMAKEHNENQPQPQSQPHYAIHAHIDTKAKSVKCEVVEYIYKEDASEEESDDRNFASSSSGEDDGSDSDSLDELFRSTDCGPDQKVIEEFGDLESAIRCFHYAVFDEGAIIVEGNVENELVDATLKRVCEMGVKKIGLSFFGKEGKSFVTSGFAPDDAVKFLHHYRKNFYKPETSEGGKKSHSELDYFLLKSEPSVMLELSSRIPIAISFMEQFLKRANNDGGKLGFFSLVFHVPVASNKSFRLKFDDFITRVCQFATVKMDMKMVDSRMTDISLDKHGLEFMIAFSADNGRIDFGHHV